MKIANVKNMSDKEVYNLLNNLSNRNVKVCCKCGEILFKQDRITLYRDVSSVPKKLCSLCNDCYTELLDYMSDKEVYNLLNNLSNRNVKVCCKCGEILFKQDRITLYRDASSVPKKLCSLCNDCYTELLDYLGVNDI